MPILLGLCALGVFSVGLLSMLSGWVSITVALHAVLGIGALPLIASAMLHFVPVLTRSAGAPEWMVKLPYALQAAGALALFFVAGQAGLGVLHTAAGLAWLAVAGLAVWLIRRARKCLGAPHPGWRWYLAALFCLLAGLAAIGAAYEWPVQYAALRLAHVRLNLLGFIGLTALGTLHVLLPTVFGTPDPRTVFRLRQDLWFALGGVLMLGAAGFLTPLPVYGGLALSAGGAALLISCGLRLAWAWINAYGRRLAGDGVALLLCVALGGWFLVLTCVVWESAGGGVSVPMVFVVAFLMPLVSGALSQLIPVWAHPGRLTPARLACRGTLVRAAPARVLLHGLAGLAAASGERAWAISLAAGALAFLIFGLLQAYRAGLLTGTKGVSV